jgi:hypothetical protein
MTDPPVSCAANIDGAIRVEHKRSLDVSRVMAFIPVFSGEKLPE